MLIPNTDDEGPGQTYGLFESAAGYKLETCKRAGCFCEPSGVSRFCILFAFDGVSLIIYGFRLITRTLTKYPVDYALYRELLQNSADAKATSVIISFKSVSGTATDPEVIESLHDAPVNRLTVSNNGQRFEEDDWSRLREIAKGNPNESKIGAFGVGFYSVFEVTDEPLVHSGSEAMSFYYVEDQLRYRKDTVESSSEWTVIDLPYRAPGTLPNLVSFTAFLTQSFMLVPLLSVQLEVDGTKLLKLSKTMSPSTDISIPRNISLKSPDNTLSLRSVTSEAFQVTVKYMNVTQINTSGARANLLNFGKKLLNSFITASESASDITEVTCFLRKITGTVSVNVSRNFSAKMKETVMKPPPKEAIISMLSHSREEKNVSELKPPLSDYIFPKEYNDAKIYIGFPTKQSTSMKSHLAMSQLIPTMERTAIDMSNSFVKTWNEQMLYMAGVLSRVVYDHEMNDLSSITNESDRTENACYIMCKFAFHRSTPDAIVGKWIASGFWRSCTVIPIPAQLGIYPSHKVRFAGDATFIKNVPIIPDLVFSKAGEFIEKAQMLGLIEELSPDDIVAEVQSRTFDITDLKLFITWCARSLHNESLTWSEAQRILKETVVAEESSTYQLGLVRTFQLKQTIDDDLPLPPSSIRQDFVSSISLNDLQAIGWTQLTIVQWLDYIVRNRATLPVTQNLSVSVEFANRVLKKVSENWFSLGRQEQQNVVELLGSCTCIPTHLGMKTPSESYLVEIPMFPHLPVRSKSIPVTDSFLLSLGLRESVDMEFVLKLLHNPEPGFEWSTLDVTKYLTANRKKLKASDWHILRTSSFFEADDGKLHKAHELYSPNQSLKDLGFSTLKWGSWDDKSNEAALLYEIGLRRCPTIHELFSAATNSREKSNIALQYYIENFSRNNYSEGVAAKVQTKIIPCSTNGTVVTLESPSSCYSSQDVEMFGFPIVQKKYRTEAWKLGVQSAPKIHLMANALITNPPKSHSEAEKKFSYLSPRANELNSLTIQNIAASKFIPVEHDGKVTHHTPDKVFLELPDADNESVSSVKFFKRLFNFVQYADSAIPFLLKSGVRYSPKLPEIVRMVLNDPYTAYNESGGRENYESFLLEIATSWSRLSTDRGLVSLMQKSRFLIGLVVDRKQDDETGENKETERVSLVGVTEVAIVDDVIAFNWFKNYIKTAPQVRELEKFYHALGASFISQVSYENITRGRIVQNLDASSKLKKHLIERCTLFLEGRPDGSPKIKLQDLQIQLVTSIEVVRQAILGTVRTPAFRESISASLDQRNPRELSVVVENNGWTVDWYDLSKAVVKLVLSKPSPESVIVLETYLSSDLGMLRRKGINVDRLLREKQREKEQAEVERARLQKEAEERRKEEEIRKQEVRRQEESDMRRAIEESKKSAPQPQVPQHKSPTEGPLQPDDAQRSLLPQPSPSSNSSSGSSFFGKLKKSISGTNHKSPNTDPQNTTKPPSVRSVQQHPETPASSDATSQRLQEAVNQTKPFTGKELNSKTVDVDDREVEFSCQRVSPTELRYVTRIPGGPSCYVRKHGTNFGDVEMTEASRFKMVLVKMAEVSYGLDVVQKTWLYKDR